MKAILHLSASIFPFTPEITKGLFFLFTTEMDSFEVGKEHSTSEHLMKHPLVVFFRLQILDVIQVASISLASNEHKGLNVFRPFTPFEVLQ